VESASPHMRSGYTKGYVGIENINNLTNRVLPSKPTPSPFSRCGLMRPEATVLQTGIFLAFLQRPAWSNAVQGLVGGCYQNKVLTSGRFAGVMARLARVDGSSWLHERKSYDN